MAHQTKVVLVLLLPLVATALVIVEKQKSSSCCPDGWAKFGGRCFKHQATGMDWASAEKYCLNLGANLVSIHNADEYKWFQSFVSAADNKNIPTWIGLHNCQKRRTWLWSDGTQLTFTKWNPTEPDFQGTECCVGLNWGDPKDWFDAPCEWSFYFVCAKSLN